uniref:Uncharacterized protein n=2 Tax=Avena sativa TaxID=4498 RepID=A0ACD5WT05_AVESA
MAMANNRTIKIGLWGGHGGQPRDISHPPGTLVSVTVRSGDAIDNIKFTYMDIDGILHKEEWGGPGGDAHDPIYLEDGQYVKEISGTYGPWSDVPALVTSLKFVTNRGQIHEYGVAGDAGSFHVPLINGQITGFCARVGDLIDAIGIYVVLP